MAKDDYDVIMAKILVYLYARLKGKNKTPEIEFLHPLSKDFPVEEDYFYYTLDEMLESGYIRMHVTRAWGGDIVLRDIDGMKITHKGIEYLRDNSVMRKIANTLPMAAAIFELFQ